MVWEIVFMLVILKIPIVYLCVGRLVCDQGGAVASRSRCGRRGARYTPAARPLAASAFTTAEARAPARSRPRLQGSAKRRYARMSTLETRSDRHSPVDVVAGFMAVASIVLSAIAMGLGLDPGARRETCADSLPRDYPRARLGPPERPLPVARPQGGPLRDGRLGGRHDARRAHREPADLGALPSESGGTGTTHR